VSIIAFLLSTKAPGDPVQNLIQTDLDQEFGIDVKDQAFRYREVAKRLHLDQPVFYFGIHPLAFPDTLHRILPLEKRAAATALIRETGNWKAIQKFKLQLNQQKLKNSNNTEVMSLISRIEVRNSTPEIKSDLKLLEDLMNKSPEFAAIQNSFKHIAEEKQTWKKWIPVFQWNGAHNRYHNWFSNFIKGDFGISMRDGRPSKAKISEALKWTLSMNLIAIFLTFLISIPLGVYQAEKRGSRFDLWTSKFFYVLFSIPVFWLATLLIVFFTSNEYGAWTNWFPSVGVYIPNSDLSFTQQWIRFSSKLILPIFCIVLVSIAYLSKQMRNGIISEFSFQYAKTAQAKGLSKRATIWKHLFKNALFPMITIFAAAIPASIASSVVIEVIFNIPGIGRMMFTSITNQDWPIVFAILMLIAIVTMLSFLIADLLYAWVNPKVKYESNE
jgi:peptide/nickel transport system permease protein